MRIHGVLLSETERGAICHWLDSHGLDPDLTPYDCEIDYDGAVDEWVVDQFVRELHDGKPSVKVDWGAGEVVVVRVRRRNVLPLPEFEFAAG